MCMARNPRGADSQAPLATDRQLVEFGYRSRQNLVGRSLGYDRHEQAKFCVELDERSGASFVGFQTDGDGFWAIILPLKKAPAAVIAYRLKLWRSILHIEYRLTFFTGAASTEALDNLSERQFVVDDRAESELFFLHQLFERLRLPQRAWKSVEDEAAATEQAVIAFAHHLPDGRIGHEFAAAHIFEGCLHGGRLIAIPPFAGGAKDVPGGKMAGVEALGQKLGLGALADAGCSEENQSPRFFLLGGHH